MTKYSGIKGLEGREQVGAVITAGRKSIRGFPEETDRYHIVQPREENGVRKPHPGFSLFNSAPPERRKVIRGNLVHAYKDDCFESHLKAQSLGKKMHPNKKPYCIGDGVKATRWSGGDPDAFNDMNCPNKQCEFRLSSPPTCKPFLRFLFRVRWVGESTMPSFLVKFTSGSWNTAGNFKGFFDYWDNVARELGMKDYKLFGLPITLTLAYQTKPSEKTKFPVTTISSDADPVEFFMRQQSNMKELAADELIAITDESEQTPELVYEDVKSISKPATLF